MFPRRRFFHFPVLAVLCCCAAAAQDFGSAAPFRDGDTVTFVGDSITHGGTYHSIVTLFYATRFPERNTRFYNCGVGGDRASMIMSDERYRLNVDILSHKPTAATIMLGMNDVEHALYRGGKSGPEIEERRRRALDTYRENMAKLIKTLRDSGARLVLITPSIYDETTKLEKANPDISVGGNGALGKCAVMVREFAKQFDAGLVNFYDVMNDVNAREQKKDPAFTIVGPDRVHPGPVGHFVMAYTLLKAQGMPREVARIGVNAKSRQADRAANCKVDKIARTRDGVEFDALEGALPLVAPEAARPALELVPFARDLNQETLAVSGLAKGRYTLLIDGEAAGEYSAADLKAGVNLADNARTPQYRQSEEATRINSERTRIAALIRDVNAQKYAMSRAKVDVLDPAALAAAVQTRWEAATRDGKPADRRLETLRQWLGEPGKLEKDYKALAAALVKACQPRTHHFALARVGK